MPFQYDFAKLKEAILFNTIEVLPTDEAQLDKEIQSLVENANKSGQLIRHYIGFEISGQIHFPGGVYQMMNVAKLQQAGVECVIWLADYHTLINKKLDGKMETINAVAHNYFEPVLKKCLEVAGGNPDELKVLYAEDEYFRKDQKNLSFWHYEFEVEKNITLSRILRSLSITGKEAGESVDYQVTRYPGMQAADVFWLRTHIVQAGLDQRKIYVLARDHAKNLDENYQLSIGDQKVKPIIFFNELLLGLEKPASKVVRKVKAKNLGVLGILQEEYIRLQNSLLGEKSPYYGLNLESYEDIEIDEYDFESSKMSKSKPNSAIWVHDDYDDISYKLRAAYCPMIDKTLNDQENEEIQKFNPILDWSKKMIFPGGKTLEVIRPEKFGGNKNYTSFEELKADYFAGNLHPLDLKNAVASCLADWFTPIREFVLQNPAGLELVKSVTGKK